MKVLMTGATGLIGSEIGKVLKARGHELIIVSRQTAGHASSSVQWQPSTEDFPVAALDGVDAVIHLAGESIASGLWTEKKKQQIYDSRVLSTRKLVQAFKNCKAEGKSVPSVLINGSAVGIYGDQGDTELKEDSVYGHDFLSQVCKDWEQAADGASHLAVRVVKVRTGFVCAPFGGALEKIIPVFSLGAGGPLGSGKQWMSWIHLKDIANLFVFALENKNVEGPINGAAPYPVTNKNFTALLAKALGRPAFVPAPAFVLKTVLGEMSTLLLSSQKCRADKVLDAGFSFEFNEFGEAIKDIVSARSRGR